MRTLDELDSWLADHDDFADCHLAGVSGGGPVTLRLRRTVADGRVPGSPLVFEVHELVAEEVVEFVRPESHSPDHCFEGVAVGEVGDHLCVEVFVPDRLYLAARSFTARHVGTERTTVPPHVVEHQFTVLTLPDGGFWIERVGALVGEEVVWRAHGSGARAPGLDPDGCFLQTATALDSTLGGVWCTRGASTTTFSRTFSRTFPRTDAASALWHAVRVVAAEAGSVRTGNCVLTPRTGCATSRRASCPRWSAWSTGCLGEHLQAVRHRDVRGRGSGGGQRVAEPVHGSGRRGDFQGRRHDRQQRRGRQPVVRAAQRAGAPSTIPAARALTSASPIATSTCGLPSRRSRLVCRPAARASPAALPLAPRLPSRRSRCPARRGVRCRAGRRKPR
ncbi:hypothetical protein DFJ66_7476 [Saccharothrix variisporea]|uniref:Uncharacterized protein n=2 Tax=Saccharothrix variisporea TaxID=543527 RepID=A0A495XMJ7_9PSEU|nr:hypothetical protein DFJ66_7476 [Saccharothrix variisporea]